MVAAVACVRKEMQKMWCLQSYGREVCHTKNRRVRGVHKETTDDTDTEVEFLEDSEEEYTIKSIKQIAAVNNAIFAELMIDGKTVSFQVDSGASPNVLPMKHLPSEAKVEKTNTMLECWNKSKLTCLGEARITIKNPANGKKYSVKFVVVEEEFTPLLGNSASQKMKLITVNHNNITTPKVNAVKTKDLIEEYADVFHEEVGKLPGTVHLETDPTIMPVVSPSKRLPVNLKEKLKVELDKMCSQGVIKPVKKATSWVSSLSIQTKSNGSLRVCIDPRPLNTALIRQRFQLPILDDLLPELNKARVFTTADLRSGYWHLALDEESQNLLVFDTPYGLYKWKRLPFGINAASEIFQKQLYKAVGNLQGVVCVADDIIVYGAGVNDADALRNHDENLENLLQKCRENNIRLNKEKLKLCQTSVPFLGHIITNEGLKPDPAKIEAVLKMPRPEDVAGVQRLGGFVNYLAKFLPRISDVMAPIRQLTRKDVLWSWGDPQETAFLEIQRLVSEAPILSYYDPGKKLVLQCDASQKGLGVALTQDGHPLAYASRALTDTETRYAQIEKELLAIVYGCEKFHQYTFGNDVDIHSDHRPLESIMLKKLSDCPRRLQNMLMRLQHYNVTVTYKPGKEMFLADTLSRAYVEESLDSGEEAETINVNAISTYVPFTDARLIDLRNATDEDETMQKLKSEILNGWPDEKHNLPSELHGYFTFRDQLVVQDGLVFRGERIVIPYPQRKLMKEKVHSSHIGAEGCVRRARECMFWPNMADDIRQYVDRCAVCKQYDDKNPNETLMCHEVPDRPWAKV